MKEYIVEIGCSECPLARPTLDDGYHCFLTGSDVTDCFYGVFETSHPTQMYITTRGCVSFGRMQIPSAPIHGQCPLWSEDGLVIKFKLK